MRAGAFQVGDELERRRLQAVHARQCQDLAQIRSGRPDFRIDPVEVGQALEAGTCLHARLTQVAGEMQPHPCHGVPRERALYRDIPGPFATQT